VFPIKGSFSLPEIMIFPQIIFEVPNIEFYSGRWAAGLTRNTKLNLPSISLIKQVVFSLAWGTTLVSAQPPLIVWRPVLHSAGVSPSATLRHYLSQSQPNGPCACSCPRPCPWRSLDRVTYVAGWHVPIAQHTCIERRQKKWQPYRQRSWLIKRPRVPQQIALNPFLPTLHFQIFNNTEILET